MNRDEIKEFHKIKEQVIDNLEEIEVRIGECEDQGMLDSSSALYNQILVLLDDADIVKTYEELEEVIERGKEVEHNIDTWLALHGGNTMELDWPHFPKK